mmetsp:Transcript_33645/g.76598  ORF Transcript_33645/g.76598 Transcript_33645/m.76598 type:complete len:213 (-) Transcript_33645:14-652(-)
MASKDSLTPLTCDDFRAVRRALSEVCWLTMLWLRRKRTFLLSFLSTSAPSMEPLPCDGWSDGVSELLSSIIDEDSVVPRLKKDSFVGVSLESGFGVSSVPFFQPSFRARSWPSTVRRKYSSSSCPAEQSMPVIIGTRPWHRTFCASMLALSSRAEKQRFTATPACTANSFDSGRKSITRILRWGKWLRRITEAKMFCPSASSGLSLFTSETR